MLGVRTQKLFLLTFILYILYLILYGCRTASPHQNPLVQVTCTHLQQLVYPFWDKSTTVFAKFDDSLGISYHFTPIWDSAMRKWHRIDSIYRLSETTQLIVTWAKIAATEVAIYLVRLYLFVSNYYFEILHPTVRYYSEKYKLYLEYFVDNGLSSVRHQSWFAYKKAEIWSCYILSTKVYPTMSWLFAVVSSNKYVIRISELLCLNWVASELRSLCTKLKLKSAEINTVLQEKTEFLRSEFGAMHNLQSLKKSLVINNKQTIETLIDVTNDFTRYRKQPDSEAAAKFDSSDDSGEEVVTVTLTRTLAEYSSRETKQFEKQKKLFSAINEVEPEFDLEMNPVDTEVDSDNGYKEEQGSQEPNIDLATSNATIDIPSDASFSFDNIVSFKGGSRAQIDNELRIWEERINSTMHLAEDSLDFDFAPYLDDKLSQLKDAFSANFTTLQSENYERYKRMADLIYAINKDSEFIRTNNTIIEEPDVDRQAMRDKIQEARESVELQMQYADDELAKAHAEILEAYFKVAQATVDVLESFAEASILDFSARLKALIDFAQKNHDHDDKTSWHAWKKFHQIKESVFKIRDKIFDEAYAYKNDSQAPSKPKTLRKWDEFLRNINFHIGFLLRDNDEYLKLVRAQANVAYQEREGLTQELSQKQEAEKKAAERSRIKAEQERLEKEELDKKLIEQLEQERLSKKLEVKSEQERIAAKLFSKKKEVIENLNSDKEEVAETLH